MRSPPSAAGTERRGRRPVAQSAVSVWFAATEGARAALGSIRAHGFRSFLTTLGIVIGVASVIAMVSIIQGLSFTIGQQFQGLGSNSVTVQSYTSLENAIQGRRSRLTERGSRPNPLSRAWHCLDHADHVLAERGKARSVTVRRRRPRRCSARRTRIRTSASIFPRTADFLSDSDNDTRRRVAVIGEQVREDLSLPENPVGEFVQIRASG